MTNSQSPIKPVTVAELVKFLQQQPQDLTVAFKCMSEYLLLNIDDIIVDAACVHRSDGWVARARPDKNTTNYLFLPGN